jgi:hypothetical protein
MNVSVGNNLAGVLAVVRRATAVAMKATANATSKAKEPD